MGANIQLIQLPNDAWEFIASKASTQISDHITMLEYYYKKVDKRSNPVQNAIDVMLDDDDFWRLRGGRIQEICNRGSVRSGKSYLSFCKPLEWLHKFPKSKWLCMRRTNSQLVTSMMQPLRDFLTRFRVPFEYKLPSMTGPGEIRLPNQSAFVFISSESVVLDPASDNARGLGSMEFAGATLEEADTLHKQVVDTVPQRLSQQTGCPHVIFYNINPTRKDHWIAKKFSKKKDNKLAELDLHEFKFTILDNIAHLEADWVESMLNSKSANPVLYRRFILGEWGPETTGTPIYGSYFNRERHVAKTSFLERWTRDQLYRDGDVCLCWDFGFKHPALVVFQDVKIGSGDDYHNHTFQQIRVLAAWLGDDTTIGPFARYFMTQLRLMLPNANFVSYGDPQGRNKDPRGVTNLDAFDIIQAETGIRTQASRTDETAGIDLIIDLFGRQMNHKVMGSQPEIVIEPNEFYTGDFITMLETGFCSADKETGVDKVRPVEDMYYIHLADAWRYGMVHRRHPRIGNLFIGSQGIANERDGYTNISYNRQPGDLHYSDEYVEFDMGIPLTTAWYGF